MPLMRTVTRGRPAHQPQVNMLAQAGVRHTHTPPLNLVKGELAAEQDWQPSAAR